MGFQTRFTVEWGDCDAAGIVFYPRYFYWLDCTYQRWCRAQNITQRVLQSRFGALTPLIDVGASFRAPASYDDELEVAATVTEWHDKRFRLGYRLQVGERVIAEGFELRAFARSDNGRLRGATIPAEFRAALEEGKAL